MQKRNATVAVIGAGDYIGAEIVKKFASEGFTVFAGRRNGEKLAPLVKDVEDAGGAIVAHSLDARKEEEIAAFLKAADDHGIDPPAEFDVRPARRVKERGALPGRRAIDRAGEDGQHFGTGVLHRVIPAVRPLRDSAPFRRRTCQRRVIFWEVGGRVTPAAVRRTARRGRMPSTGWRCAGRSPSQRRPRRGSGR